MEQPNINLYEAHVTIEPVFDERFKQFGEICRPFHFKPAELLLKKNRQDTEERSNKDSFCTGHGKTYEDTYNRVMALVDDLIRAGFQVWRYKIEGIVLDVKLDRKLSAGKV